MNEAETRLALFGFAVRDAARDDSDVDVLVAFEGAATSKRYFGARFYLEDLLKCPVDLITGKALRPELRPSIERERDVGSRLGVGDAEIWEALGVSRQGAMDLLRSLLDAGLVEKVGGKKTGRYVLRNS